MAALEARLDRDLERGTTGVGPHLDDVAILAGDRDLRASARRASSAWPCSRCCWRRPLIAERSTAPPLLLLDDVLSELDRGAGVLAGGAARLRRPDVDHRDDPRGARPASRRSSSRSRRGACGRLMERIERTVRRGSSADSGRRRESADRRRLACGGRRAIARNAWPARLSRDGTLHVHAKVSAWAFELDAARRRDPRPPEATAAPPGCGSRPGQLPGALRDRARSRLPQGPRRPGGASARRELAAGIEDESLRKLVAKSGRREPREGRRRPGFLDTLPARKGEFAGLF